MPTAFVIHTIAHIQQRKVGVKEDVKSYLGSRLLHFSAVFLLGFGRIVFSPYYTVGSYGTNLILSEYYFIFCHCTYPFLLEFFHHSTFSFPLDLSLFFDVFHACKVSS